MNEGYFKNTIIYAIGDIVSKVLALVSFPILTSYLTTADYGIVNFINSITMFLLIFSILNLNTYYLISYHKQETIEDERKLLGNLSAFLLMYNFAILLISMIGGYMYDLNFASEISFFPFIFIGIASNFFNVFSILPLASLRAKKKAITFATINITKNALQLVFTIVAVVVFKMTALGVLYSILAANIIFALYYLKYTFGNAKFIFRYAEIRRALTFSLPLVPGALAYLLITLSDRIIISHFLSFNVLGIYSTAATIGILINIVSTGFYQAIEPHVLKSYNNEGFVHEFMKIRKIFFLVLMITGLGLCLYAQEFLFYLSNPSFHGAYKYVPLLLIGGILAGLNLLYSTLITASGRTKTNSVNIIAGCMVSVVLNFILVPLAGIAGASISFACAFSVMLILSVYKSKYPSFNKQEIAIALIWLTFVLFFVYLFNRTPSYLSILIKAAVITFFTIITFRLLGIRNIKALYKELFK